MLKTYLCQFVNHICLNCSDLFVSEPRLTTTMSSSVTSLLLSALHYIFQNCHMLLYSCNVYLSKLQKCIFANCKLYLSDFLNIFVSKARLTTTPSCHFLTIHSTTLYHSLKRCNVVFVIHIHLITANHCTVYHYIVFHGCVVLYFTGHLT